MNNKAKREFSFLFCLFIGILTFVSYLMSKNNYGTIWPIDGRIRGYNIFSKSITSERERNIRLELELAYYNVRVQHLSHLKKLSNMKLAEILIVVGALGTFPEGLEKRLEELEISRRIKTNQITELLRSARIIRIALKTRGNLLLLWLQWNTIRLCR